MKVYQLDVISRLDFELAELTSTFGEILKIDSTKKITNKLAGNMLWKELCGRPLFPDFKPPGFIRRPEWCWTCPISM